MAYIDCKDLILGYENKHIVDNLTFCVDKGDYLCILGENGSGKSTLMKTLLGLNRPISGRISFGDGLSKREIGYLPQHSAPQRDFPASVFEVVISGCLGRSYLPFYSKKQKELAEQSMHLVGISDISNKCYRELSGGQQQRTLLARALCASSKLILLDEPVTGLDPRSTDDMYKIIKDLNNRGISVIMVSHDAKALEYASRVLHMSRTSLFFGRVSDYRKSDVGSAFLKGAFKGGR